ncbi:acetyl-CoA carboxylase carboxyltransferase subunit alpha [Frankia torreyi]|uniref:Multifunctional fusion protein n=1 Tax=Frankia torreyi TaxID=1856 RepID=A0A0D8BET6_9ACTN|nr:MULTISPECIES: acetyl-CoA carboxylase carboxyl transferase subunit [Frankia]KJE21922.1 acetyl-CoA carboxylase carboxyltransferase subunit alpha [Frankia torreyi]KQM05299.1 acetyl-CoA carboxylase carboxyltransferase subunit alpha [Frankia sp. CpI1-P]
MTIEAITIGPATVEPTTVEPIPRRGPGSTWLLCGGCGTMLYERRFARDGRVCPDCSWHAPMTIHQRLDLLLDADSARPVDVPAIDGDPLEFTDTRPYRDRLRDARASTGLDEAAACVRGTVDGNPVVVVVMDFRFLGGSLGATVGEVFTRAAELALRERTPLLTVTASGGARMQEGAIALMQMAKTSQALGQLDEAGILTVSLITDPTFGGVAASFATLADVIIAEPGARLGFAGRRVIEQTIRQSLPEDFQTAEFLLAHGVVDLISPRHELRANLARLLSVSSRRADGIPRQAGRPDRAVVTDPEQLARRDAWESVRAARRLGRPTTLDYAAMILEDFTELRGDRMSADCPALVAGLGRLDGIPVAVLGTQKGHTADELRYRNFGMPTPAGYRKSARVMRLAAKLGLPVITLIDTAGAYPGIEAEEQAQAVAIAENLRLMAGLPVPVVAVVTGEGGSGGALALAFADRVLMCANAVYSVISAEGCAAILWKNPAAAPTAAAALRVDARELLRLGVVDGVIPEPDGGADADPAGTAARLREALRGALADLLPLDQMNLVTRRRARFRQFGVATPASAPVPAPAPSGDAHESQTDRSVEATR